MVDLGLLDGADERRPVSSGVVGYGVECVGDKREDYFLCQGKRSAEKFIAMIDKYQDFDTMTTTMLNEFVEKILVHERDQKGRQVPTGV